MWERLARSGEMPRWLVRWVELCHSTHERPDYAAFRRLIAEGEQEAAAAAAATAKAAERAAHLAEATAWLAEE